MVKKKRRGKGKAGVPRYFSLNGSICQPIHVQRSRDLLTVWDFTEEKEKVFVLSDVRKHMQNVFNVTEVAEMINRHPDRVYKALYAGHIPTPESIQWKWGHNMYLFNEDEVLEVWDYFSNVHIGRPRKDGKITNNSVPTREEIILMMRSGGKVLYVEQNGEYIPVWKAESW